MAWDYVAQSGPTVTLASGGDLTLVEPTGAAQGDLLVACIAYRSTPAFTLPAGWGPVATQQSSGDIDTTNGIASGVMAYIVRGASAPSYVFTRTAGDVALGRVICYRGSTATPYDTGSANTLAVASATVTTGTITTAEAGELIVAMMAGGDSYTTSAFDAATDPATASGATDTTTEPTAGTWIERADSGTTIGADTSLAVADAIRATAGATGQIQCTTSGIGRSVMIAGAFKVAADPTTGTAAQTTTKAAQSASGTETFTGTAASTQNEAAQAASGTVVVPVTGTAVQTITKTAQAASGTETFTGTAAQSAIKTAQSATGTETFTGTAAQSIDNAAQSAAGAEAFTGTAAQTITKAAQEAAGTAGSAGATGAAEQTATISAQAATGSITDAVVGVPGGGVGYRPGVGKLTDAEWEKARKRFAKARQKRTELESKAPDKAKAIAKAQQKETEAYLRIAEWGTARAAEYNRSLEAQRALEEIAAFKINAAIFNANMERQAAEMARLQEEEELMIMLLA